MNVIVILEALLICAAIIFCSFVFIAWGLSGGLKRFFSFKKKNKEMNDGGW